MVGVKRKKGGMSRAMVSNRRKFNSSNFKRVSLRLPRNEPKEVDLANANYPISTTASITLLNGVALGSDNFNRIGREITMKYLRVKGDIRETGVAGGNEYCRIAIVYDRQANFAAPVYTDIFAVTTNAGVQSSTAESLPNEAKADRFLILKDFTVSLPSSTAGVASGNNVPFDTTLIDWYIPLKGLGVKFLGTGSTIASITAGSLYMVVIGRAAAAGTEVWEFTGSLRLNYVE